MNYEQQVEVRRRALERLAAHGIWMAQTATLTMIATKIEQVTGKKRRQSLLVSDYVAAWVETRERINPPYRPTFQPLRPAQHPRMADIQRAQPPMMTPTGTGNWNQYTSYMMGNGRAR